LETTNDDDQKYLRLNYSGQDFVFIYYYNCLFLFIYAPRNYLYALFYISYEAFKLDNLQTIPEGGLNFFNPEFVDYHKIY
jgi:hypothetical protein